MTDPASPTTDPASPTISLTAVLAEIDEEVRAKRASGELPADLERQLDTAFARFAPVDAVTGDFDVLLAKLADATTFDTRAPVASSRPGGARIKSLISLAIDWELRHLAGQASGAAHALTRALGLLGARVDNLERDAPSGADKRLWALGVGRSRRELPPGEWLTLLGQTFAGCSGRVLHAEALDGQVVRALSAEGVDAYGLDPDGVGPGGDEVLDVRHDTVVDHLRDLPDGSLDGLVLTGCIDRWTPGAILELVDMAVRGLAGGGRIVVVSHHPGVWQSEGGAVADLSDGRPWAPSTWETVLTRRGFAGITVHDGAERGGGRPPAGYAVVATR
jgi:hypothetical protein